MRPKTEIMARNAPQGDWPRVSRGQRAEVGSAVLLASALLLMMGMTSGAAVPTAPYPYVKTLAAPEAPTRTIASFLLDEELFASTDGSYANLRVFDNTGIEIPSLVRCRTLKKAVARERTVPMSTAAFERLPDNRMQVIVSTNEAGHSVGAIVFHTGLKDFEKQVTVSGSQDRQTWTVLADAKPIFDYSRFLDLRNSRVDITPGAYAFYKIEIANITESHQSPLVQIVRETRGGELAGEVEKTSFMKADFRIEKMDFLEKLESIMESDRVTRSYAVQMLAITNDVKAKTTLITFDTPSVPLIELSIVTPNPNFSRSVTVEGRNEDVVRRETGAVAPAWHTLADASISRIDIGKFQQKSMAIGLGGARRFRHYRLTIHNLDNPPLDITGVEARGEVHEALFFCEPAKTYRTFYGAPDMAAPRYDIATVLARTEGADTDTFLPGRQEANPSYQPGRPAVFSGKKLLVPAVVLMVITLIWLIARTVKRVESV